MKPEFCTAWFRFFGCNEQPTVRASLTSDPDKPNTLEGGDNTVTLIVPAGKNPAFVEYQDYRQAAELAVLALPDRNEIQKTILQKVKYSFRVLYPHQYIQFTLQDSFFLQDDRRTFFARYYPPSELGRLTDTNKLSLAGIKEIQDYIPYETGQVEAVDPIPSASVSLSDLQSLAKLGILEGSSQ
jgi:hypothetical protein